MTLHFQKQSVIVCNRCIENEDVILCKNFLNHEHDKISQFVIKKEVEDEHYCGECFSAVKKSHLKQTLNNDLGKFYNNISKYI